MVEKIKELEKLITVSEEKGDSVLASATVSECGFHF